MKFSAENLKKLIKGACYFEIDRGYLTAFKYSREQMDMMGREGYDEFWRERGSFSAGIRLELRTDADLISFEYRATDGTSLQERSNSVDVWVNGILFSVLTPENRRGGIQIELPDGEKTVAIYFPCDCRFSIKNFTVNGSYKSIKDKGQRVLVIGDSITQGYGPTFSSSSYFNELQRRTGYNMLNQGIGGYRCEPNDVMRVCGFEPYKNEWWHFSDKTVYPVEKDFRP